MKTYACKISGQIGPKLSFFFFKKFVWKIDQCYFCLPIMPYLATTFLQNP